MLGCRMRAHGREPCVVEATSASRLRKGARK